MKQRNPNGGETNITKIQMIKIEKTAIKNMSGTQKNRKEIN